MLCELAAREGPVHPVDAVGVFLRQMSVLSEQSGGDLPKVGVQAWGAAVRDPEVPALAKEKMAGLRAALEVLVLEDVTPES